MKRVGQLNSDDLGTNYRIHTRDGIVEGQLWRVWHEALKVEESTFSDPEPTFGTGTIHVTVEIGAVTGTFVPELECEAIA